MIGFLNDSYVLHQLVTNQFLLALGVRILSSIHLISVGTLFHSD